MQYINHYASPLGGITLGSDGEALLGLWFDGQKYFPDILPKEWKSAELPIFQQTKRWLDIYFGGDIPRFTPPLRMYGSAFRQCVWKSLLEIPYGQTVTYGEIAGRVAKGYGLGNMSAQAVGGAVGHNAISIIIPCHRVVGANGSLTGYAGGITKKVGLLKLEKANMDKLFVPKEGTAL